MKARLTSGLATAALLTTAIACAGSANAADPSGYPHTLGFEPSELIAADDAVYALGIDGDTAYVAEVGAGAPVEIGSHAFWLDAALAADGSTLHVVTSGPEGFSYWDVDADDLSVTGGGQPPAGQSVEALGTDAGGMFDVRDVDEQGLVLNTTAGSAQLIESESSDSASIGAVAARGAVGDRTWFVAGTDFANETATLWTHDEATEATGDPVELGAAGDPDAFVESLAVDESTGVAYALSWRDNDDAPQSYGITVVQDGDDDYLPLRYRTQRIALSPDGETLYLAQNDSVFALDTDRIADYEDETDASGVSIDASVSALAVDGEGHVFAASDDGAVHAFSAPDAPADLAAEPDSMSTTALLASWNEGRYSWELDEEDLIQYSYSVRDTEGEVVASDTTYDQNLFVEGLQPGTTYTVQVTASNGLLVSETAADEVTTHDRYVGAPSAVAVQGSLTVGSQLSVVSTGSWEAGTDVYYEWYGSNGEMGGAIGAGPTLSLTADHLGMSISVVATGTKAGVAGVTIGSPATGSVSNPPVVTPPVTPPAATPVPPAPAPTTKATLTGTKPKILGKAKVGKTLKAQAGKWTKGAKLSYEWFANGKAIKGADASSLKLTKVLRGKKISVEVTGTKAGFKTLSKTSAQTAKVKR